MISPNFKIDLSPNYLLTMSQLVEFLDGQLNAQNPQTLQ